MAQAQPPKDPSTAKTPPATADWAKLTRSDLERWAGSRSVQRGRTYQRGGRVRDLKISADGALLATVVGTKPYTTTVALAPGGKRPRPESSCTCPVGISCKHAVAVVAEYLQAIAEKKTVPIAAEDDPRRAELGEVEPDLGGDEYKKAARPAAAEAGWDAKIERHIRGKTQAELADLAWSLVRRFPEVYQEFRERIALQEGDVANLVAEARREIRRVTAETAWSNRWTGEGYIPDYSKIRHRLERLRELGHADEVVALGRDFIERGMRQIAEANDEEGETIAAFGECLPVIFRAVTESSLSGPERLLFAIDAEMADNYGIVSEASGVVFEAHSRPEDWSAVADALMRRLEERPAPEGARGDDFHRNYQRNGLTNWIADALEKAGREGELQALYESEARITRSYERLVKFLRERRRYDDAERWAREGIAATVEKLPGIAAHLAGDLCELARRRKRWDVVAAHAAHEFFDIHPDVSSFEELMKAAQKAGVEEPVRAAALRFLETGIAPYRLVAPRAAKAVAVAPVAKGKRAGAQPAAAAPVPEPAPSRLEVDPAWPLPVPEELIPLLERPGRQGYTEAPRPRLNVLLDMAIAAKRPDEVLHWYDRMRAAPKAANPWGYSYGHGLPAAADRVAAAVAATHPERAIEIYRDGLDTQLPQAHPSAYENAADYLKKLRPIYASLGRAADWTALVASIRAQYRNRPRFMEALDRLEGRTIVQSTRPRRK